MNDMGHPPAPEAKTDRPESETPIGSLARTQMSPSSSSGRNSLPRSGVTAKLTASKTTAPAKKCPVAIK